MGILEEYKLERIRCTWCGRYVSYVNLNSGEAYHHMITPDSDCSVEEWETCCKKCNK